MGMSEPRLDLKKLQAVRDWAEDLADELTTRQDLLPCRALDRLGDCISRQRRYVVEEMKPSKMCPRCRTRWYAMMVAKNLGTILDAKVRRVQTAAPDFA